ncbi:MAG: tetratricopeptide repeat protein [Gemmatimonadaceae bacterium]
MSDLTRARITRARWAAPLIISLVTIVAFLPALGDGFVSWDDERNFLTNPHYRGLALDNLRWMWTTFHLGHYVPLSWMTLGLDYELWGMNAAGYHATSLLLHAANAVLVFVLARRLLALSQPDAGDESLTWPAAVAALLFAVHPLRVESVVWITERRDVLSLFFYLLTVLAYVRDRRWTSVILFACALLSKATAMTLPALLFVLDVYPLSRVQFAGRRVNGLADAAIRLAPHALLSLASVVLSIVALRPPDQLGLAGKVAVSVYSLRFYVQKTLVPRGLSPLYEMPQHVRPGAMVFVASGITCMAITLAAWRYRHRFPGVLMAWLAFVIISLPMLGVVQNGPQIAADRYTYHAAPALAMLVAGVLFALVRPAALARGIGTGLIAILAMLTWRQSHVWHDSQSLWAHALEVDDTSSLAHSAMASLLYKEDHVDEAMQHSVRAVQLAPGFAEAHNDVGVGLARQGRNEEAAASYRRALELKPTYDEAENNLGVVLVGKGDLAGAVEHYRRALEINEDNADAHVNWGNVLVRQQQMDDAIAHYQAALVIRPDLADARHNWGVALALQGKLAEAIGQFRMALALNPNHAEAREFLERATRMLQQR